MAQTYIKFEIPESISSQKLILSSQVNILNAVKRIKNYSELRNKELSKRAVLRQKIKEMRAGIFTLLKRIPKADVPEIEKMEIHYNTITKTKANQLERELEDIQKRLRELG